MKGSTLTDTYVLTGLNLIAGEWVRSDGERAVATDPATGSPLDPSFFQAGRWEVDAALSAAVQAFRQTTDVPSSRWAELLDTIANAIVDMEQPLIARAKAETALPE